MEDLQRELEQKISNIGKIFDIEHILIRKTNDPSIARYYEVLKHPLITIPVVGTEGSDDMSVERVYNATQLVEQYLLSEHARNVLEVGIGRADRSFRLSQKYSDMTFVCFDVDTDTTRHTLKKFHGVKNLRTHFGSRSTLQEYPESSFDIVFAIESLNYTQMSKELLADVSRILKVGGVAVVIDQYLGVSSGPLSKTELHARYLVGRKVALSDLETYESFISLAHEQGMVPEFEDDLSDSILQEVQRVNRFAELAFDKPLIARVLSHISPTDYICSLMSLYLLPTALRLKIARYLVTVLRKV